MPDHVHLCLSIPPKYSVAHTIGFLKGKSAVRIHRELLREPRMTGLHFSAAGYCVSTVGLEEARVRQDIRELEELERRQGEFDFDSPRRPREGLPDVAVPKGERLERLLSLSSDRVTARQDHPDRRAFTGFGLQFQGRFQQLTETFDDR